MNVSLREITPQNFKECINLKVADDQKKFVASNVVSIAQSKIYPTHMPFAIYADDEMVGFAMYGLDTDDDKYYLGRLMIDENHQGKGFGKAATLKIIEQMKEINGCEEIYLSFVPENIGAEKLYSSVGFERTGALNEGEVVMRLDLTKSVNNERAIADN